MQQPLFISIFLEAVSEIVERRWTLLQALVLPVLCMSLVEVVAYSVELSTVGHAIAWIADTALYAMFAVTCHRTIILGDVEVPGAYGLFWTFREMRFLGWIFVVMVPLFLLGIPLGAIILAVPAEWLRSILLYVAFSHVSLRFSMVFPATAVEHRASLADSWTATSGNGLSLLGAATIPVLLAMALYWPLDFALADSLNTLAHIPYQLVGFLLLAVEVGIISVAYKHITFS